MDRHIDFDGIENFRDFGGYAAHAGRRLKPRTLFRSGHHAAATEADLQRLRDLGIQVVVDLRKRQEREREPCRHEAFASRVIANDLGDHADSWIEALKDVVPDAAWFRNDCRAFYRTAPLEARHVDLFARWFHALAEAEGAALVHCAAGKDRTGMICALTHHIAGVHRDDILADYLLTNDEARISRRVPLLGAFLERHFGGRPDDAALRVGVSVEPEYLEIAFSVMSETYGSIDGYLEQALGVDGTMRETIAERILA